MIVHKQRRLAVRMGEYETHEVVGGITFDTNNEDDQHLLEPFKGWGKDASEDLSIFLDHVLQKVMAHDVTEAAFNTAEENSFIHEYKKNNTEEG